VLHDEIELFVFPIIQHLFKLGDVGVMNSFKNFQFVDHSAGRFFGFSPLFNLLTLDDLHGELLRLLTLLVALLDFKHFTKSPLTELLNMLILVDRLGSS
jgi:hypothetical protein